MISAMITFFAIAGAGGVMGYNWGYWDATQQCATERTALKVQCEEDKEFWIKELGVPLKGNGMKYDPITGQVTPDEG